MGITFHGFFSITRFIIGDAHIAQDIGNSLFVIQFSPDFQLRFKTLHCFFVATGFVDLAEQGAEALEEWRRRVYRFTRVARPMSWQQHFRPVEIMLK